MRRLVVVILVAVAAIAIWWWTRSSPTTDPAARARDHVGQRPSELAQTVKLADGGMVTVHETSCAGWLHGVITDLVGGGPIDGADVMANGKIHATSADDGSFALCLVPGNTMIVVVAEGFTQRMGEVFVTSDTQKDFALSQEAIVTGDVIFQATKKPAPNVDVTLNAARGQILGKTDAAGHFELHHVPSDNFRVFAGGDGYFSRTQTFGFTRVGETFVCPKPIELVAITESEELVLVAHPATISGHTTRNGKPISGVSIATKHAHTISKDDGSYQLTNLEAGEYTISAEMPSVAFTRPKTVKVAPDEHVNLDFELDLAGTIHGFVVDQNDAPVVGATLNFSLLGTADYGNATTHEDGSFSATAMVGGGQYLMQVRDRASQVLDPAAGGRWPKIAVADGKADVDAGKLRVRIEMLKISGHVVDDGGASVVYLQVIATGNDHTFTVTSDRDGAFTVEHVKAGMYDLGVVSAGGYDPMKVEAGATGVVLHAAKPGAIAVHLAGASNPMRVSIYGHSFRDEVMIDHDYTFSALPVGSYSIDIDEPITHVRVELHAGETAQVTLAPFDAGTVVLHPVRAGVPISATCVVAGPPQVGTEIRFEQVVAGRASTSCRDETGHDAFAEFKVITGQTTDVTVTFQDAEHHDSGVTFESQFSEVLVSSVVPGGPAARANVRAGDIVITLNGENVAGAYSEIISEIMGTRATNTLGLERDGQRFSTTITAP